MAVYLSLPDQLACDRLRDFAAGMEVLALGLTSHASRRERALGDVPFPQKAAQRLATIADLRRRADLARADRATALARISEIEQQGSAGL